MSTASTLKKAGTAAALLPIGLAVAGSAAGAQTGKTPPPIPQNERRVDNGTVTPAPAAPASSGTAGKAASAARLAPAQGEICYNGGGATGSAKAAAGNTLYTFWQRADFCMKNGAPSRIDVYDTSGETKTPTWSYEGLQDKTIRSNSSRYQVVTRYKFKQTVMWWSSTTTECLRVNYWNSGSITSDYGCTTTI